MNNSTKTISSKSLGESKRHECPVVASRLATGKEGMAQRRADDDAEYDLAEELGLHTGSDGAKVGLRDPSKSAPLARLVRGAGRGAQRGNKAITALIGGQFSFSITKNAATTTVTAISATSFADWTSYIALYDEVTFLSGDIWFNYDSTGMTSANTTANFACWDPVDSTPAATGNDVVCYACKHGPFIIPTGASMYSATGTSHPTPRGNENGYYHIRMVSPRMGKGALNRRPDISLGSTPSPINIWLPTAASGITFGFFKPYYGNPNAAVNGTSGFTVRVRLGFRLRNG